MPADPAPSTRSSRRLLRKAWFALIPLLLILLAGEGVVRVYRAAARTSYFKERPADGATVVTFQGQLITHDFKARKEPGTFRIFCLGASSIQGFHLAAYSTIPMRIEWMLGGAAPAGARFEVINLGVMGVTSREVLEIFRQSLAYE